MPWFSARNTLAWIAGAAGLLALFLLKLGIFDGIFGALVLCGAGVAGLYWLYQQQEQWRHSRHIKEFAERNGWTYYRFGGDAVSTLTGFPFDGGTDQQIADVIEGMYGGTPCKSFTYSFTYNVAGERSGEQVFTVTQARLAVPLPRIDLVPEDAGSRVLGALGGSDIDLESAEFNRKWRLTAADRKFAVDVVDPRMMELLLRHHLPGVAIRIEGNRVLAWSAGRAEASELSRRLDIVTGVARRIPPHVMRTFDEVQQERRAAEAAAAAEAAEREANAPTWANRGGILNSGTYTGIGVDADGDGVEDWEQRNR